MFDRRLAALWVIAFFALYIVEPLNRVTTNSVLVLPIVVLPLLAAAMYTVAKLAAKLWKQEWLRALQVVLLTCVPICVAIAVRVSGIDAYWLYFQVARPYYEHVVSGFRDQAPRHHVWDWGGEGGVAVANTFYWLVFDGGDQPLRSEDPNRWLSNEGHDIEVQSYGHHFFLVTETYQ